MEKLTVVGSVLYVAAHPDDENTAVLTWLENEKLVRAGYLSMTRGDGGQNLIGDEQGDLLGVIRTQELLAARLRHGRLRTVVGWNALHPPRAHVGRGLRGIDFRRHEDQPPDSADPGRASGDRARLPPEPGPAHAGQRERHR
jgi:hypothetical protein